IDARPLADDADAHAVLVQLGQVAPDEALHQPHQVVDLARRPRPVLRREAVDGEILHAELDGGAHRAAYGLHSHAMADRARQSPLRRPPPVAVHDDRDMAGCPHTRVLPGHGLVVLVHMTVVARETQADARRPPGTAPDEATRAGAGLIP